MNKPARNGISGFTRTQLLATIAVCGVLACLLSVAFAKAREVAKRKWCNNYLKQIGLAYAQYSDDFGTNAPTVTGKISIGDMAAALSPYVSYSPRLWVCQSVAMEVPPAIYTNTTPYTGLVTYTWFPGGVWQDKTLCPLFWDKGNHVASGHGSNVAWSTTSAHKGDGGMVLWNDGHVDWSRTMNSTYGSVTLSNCQNP